MASKLAVSAALQSQRTAFGFWLTLPSAGAAKTILRSHANSAAKFSWVLVDAEHGLISDSHYYELNNAIAFEGASPIIRVPWPEEWLIKRALDSGAHGVMTPMCHSAADAENIVKYSKYPPVGSRGYGPMFANHALPNATSGAEYDNKIAKELLVFVQIESKSGLENVEKIAQVNGIDVLFIGPFDLAKQNGIERGGKEHEAAIQRILKAAHDAGKKAAIFCTDGIDARNRTEQGFDLVSIITDVAVLGEGFKAALDTASGAAPAGDVKPRDSY